MTPDISQLNLDTPDQIDWDQYQGVGTGTGKPIPAAGTYTVVTPDNIEYDAKDGKLIAKLDPLKVIGPTNAGYEVRFTRISTKKYSNRNASPAGDYFKAHGLQTRPASQQDYLDAFQSTLGRPFQVDLDWEAYDKETRETIAKSMADFPDDGQGGKQRFIVNPATGNKVWANVRVKRYRPAV